ncbi:hypothetical protein BD410DRAFT_602147 [Rickenella mellea]|uniref:Uncharacterized protein n=1 Tax=Rickenella mellea TaxID=50990 RepID=A0A4Y7QFJ1_9AGAM|nr:hypothetical protein BD410DRAFT_602147 [Rickenella mellea]
MSLRCRRRFCVGSMRKDTPHFPKPKLSLTFCRVSRSLRYAVTYGSDDGVSTIVFINTIVSFHCCTVFASGGRVWLLPMRWTNDKCSNTVLQ